MRVLQLRRAFAVAGVLCFSARRRARVTHDAPRPRKPLYQCAEPRNDGSFIGSAEPMTVLENRTSGKAARGKRRRQGSLAAVIASPEPKQQFGRQLGQS